LIVKQAILFLKIRLKSVPWINQY